MGRGLSCKNKGGDSCRPATSTTPAASATPTAPATPVVAEAPSNPRWSGQEQVKKLEWMGRSPEFSPMRQLAEMVTKTGPLMSVGKEPVWKQLWLMAGGKDPRKEFLRAGLLKRPWRYCPGIVALYKICHFQKSTELLICKLPFSHLVHKIAQKVAKYNMHFQVHTVLTLKEAAEYYLVSLLEDANLCAIHAKCPKIYSKPIISMENISITKIILLPKVCFSLSVGCRLCGILPVQGKGI